MKIHALLCAICLKQIVGGPGLSRGRELVHKAHRDGYSPLINDFGSQESLREKRLSPKMAIGAKFLQELSSILNLEIDSTRKFAQVHSYVSYCNELIREARDMKNEDGLRALESMPHYNLLRFIYGEDQAERILVKRGRHILFITGFDTPKIQATNNDRVFWFDTFGQLRALRERLLRGSSGKRSKLVLCRPKYMKELIFLVGETKAEGIIEDTKKGYKKWLMRTHVPLTHTLGIGTRKTVEEQIYDTMKANVGVFRYPHTKLSYYNLDKLSLLIGKEKATELVAARARHVLTHLMGHNSDGQTDQEVLEACERTITDIEAGAVHHLILRANREYICFLVGPHRYNLP